MALLRKHNTFCLKGSTLMETLVATVLIIVVFFLASMILNNLFSNTILNNTQEIGNRLNQLQYLQIHEQIRLPYKETFENWNVMVNKFTNNNQTLIEFEAVNIKTNKTINVIKIDSN